MLNDPGAPQPTFGQGAPVRDADPDQALVDRLANRPLRLISIAATAASGQLTAEQCLLLGWSLRETTGLAGAEIEWMNGGGGSGEPVAEVAIPAPPLAVIGQTDTDVDASSANPAAANNVTLPNVAGQTTFITGFEITGAGATAASTIAVTVTGILGGTKSYRLVIPAGAGVEIARLLVEFARPIPASGVNTAIVVNVPSFGAGNTDAAVTAHGFQRLAATAGAGIGQVSSQSIPGAGVLLRSGLFMRMIAGNVTGAVWVKL